MTSLNSAWNVEVIKRCKDVKCIMLYQLPGKRICNSNLSSTHSSQNIWFFVREFFSGWYNVREIGRSISALVCLCVFNRFIRFRYRCLFVDFQSSCIPDGSFPLQVVHNFVRSLAIFVALLKAPLSAKRFPGTTCALEL